MAESVTVKTDQFLGGYEIGSTIPYPTSAPPPKPLCSPDRAVVEFFGDDFGFIVECLRVMEEQATDALMDTGASDAVLADLALAYYWRRKLNDAYSKVTGGTEN